jgi:hypothetical protein
MSNFTDFSAFTPFNSKKQQYECHGPGFSKNPSRARVARGKKGMAVGFMNK